MRVAIIGDVGGHLRPLENVLSRLGADPATGQLPDDLTVIQVGDLVHRGPDDLGVLALVERFLTAGHGRWRQLIGNHEWLHLPVRHGRFKFPVGHPEQLTAILTGWWESGLLHVAAAVGVAGVEVRRPGGLRETVGAGGLLITHAGLTSGVWNAVGQPGTAQLAATALNAHTATLDGPAWNLGEMIGTPPTALAGPMWASASELFGSWAESRPPFHQANGHTSIYWPPSARWQWPLNEWVQHPLRRDQIHFAPDTRMSRVELNGATFFGTDPGHGQRPNKHWQALVLDATSAATT